MLQPSWLKVKENGVTLECAVQPGSKSSEIAMCSLEILKIRIAAPPIDGAANEEVVDFFAQIFSVKKRDIQIIRGLQGRKKVVAVQGLSGADVLKVLESIAKGKTRVKN